MSDHECTKETQLNRIEKLLTEVHQSIHGNGNVGLKTICHTTAAQTKGQWALIVIIIGAIVGLAIGRI